MLGPEGGNWVGNPLRGGVLPRAGPLELPLGAPLHLPPRPPRRPQPLERKPILPMAEERLRILIPHDLAK